MINYSLSYFNILLPKDRNDAKNDILELCDRQNIRLSSNSPVRIILKSRKGEVETRTRKHLPDRFYEAIFFALASRRLSFFHSDIFCTHRGRASLKRPFLCKGFGCHILISEILANFVFHAFQERHPPGL